jgi:3'-phosphoadenosine 5'-phosphosulfate sulfotransferase (PAPS reductase)/FAD synthetase
MVTSLSPADVQDALFDAADILPRPDLTTYDWIVVSISGGKDSQEMLRLVVTLCIALGIADRIVCVFADLGEDDEWPGAEEMARYHASCYGLRFEVVRKGENQGRPVTLLEHIEKRGMWPDMDNRYCTSGLKRDPISTVITRLCNELRSEWKATLPKGCKARPRRVRVLNCMGLRAQESPSRALTPPFENNERLTNKSVKHVDNWLPIHSMTEDQVWAGIRESGVKYHPIYDAGMPRLSCRFCVLAGRKALVRAAQLDPEGALKRARLEDKFLARRTATVLAYLLFLQASPQALTAVSACIKKTLRSGHNFKDGLSMRDIIAEAEALIARGEVAVAANWVG